MTRPTVLRAIDRYEILGVLGEGAGGVVFEAKDIVRDQSIALKVLRSIERASLSAFKLEFRAVADLRHRNLVELYNLECVDDTWFFTMELIRAHDLMSFLRHEPPRSSSSLRADDSITGGRGDTLGARVRRAVERSSATRRVSQPVRRGAPVRDFELLRDSLAQVVLGLVALHRKGLIHRDIKPSNILVTEAGRVAVADFGVVAPTRRSADGKGLEGLVGTPEYIAPEIVAGAEPTPACDFYSLGVVLFEALTGRLPFEDGDYFGLLERKVLEDAPTVLEIEPDAPEDLATLAADLLARSPEARPRADDILLRLRPSRTLEGAKVSVRIPRRIVGRDAELETLARAFAEVRASAPTVVHVVAPSGMGKSTLLDAFVDERLARGDALVLQSRCYEREALPFKAVDRIVDALATLLADGYDPSGALTSAISAAAVLFPVLAHDADGEVDAAPYANPHGLRKAAFDGLRELLARVADGRPVVLVIDDVQWGDVDSALLLRDLLAPPGPPTLLLLGYRDEWEKSEAFGAYSQDRLAPTTRIGLSPIAPADAHAIVAHALGSDRESVVSLVVAAADGNPFALEEFARHCRSVGKIDDEISLATILRDRVAQLDDGERRLLGALALAARPIDPRLAGAAAGLDAKASEVAFRGLCTQHLAVDVGGGGAPRARCIHDRVRETLTRNLSPEVARAIHEGLVVALSASGEAEPEALMEHCRAAGMTARSVDYAVAAAEHALRLTAFERAARLYATALDLAGDAHPQRQAWRIARADALAFSGASFAASEAYQLAFSSATNDAEALELERKAAEQLICDYRLDEGKKLIAKVLARAGLDFPKSQGRAMASGATRMLRFWVRGTKFEPKPKAAIAPSDLARIDACHSAFLAYITVDMPYSFHFAMKCLDAALRTGEPYRAAQAIATAGMFYAFRGRNSRTSAERLFDQGDKLAASIGARDLEAMLSLNRALMYASSAEWRDTVRASEPGLVYYRTNRGAVRLHRNLVWTICLSAQYQTGDYRAFARAYEEALFESSHTGDANLETHLVLAPSAAYFLLRDDPAAMRDAITRARARIRTNAFKIQDAQHERFASELELYEGDVRTAAARFVKALDDAKSIGFLKMPIFAYYFGETDARVHAALALEGIDVEANCARVLKKADALLRLGMKPAEASAYLHRSTVERIRGNQAGALRELDRAAATFEAAGMSAHVHAVQARLAVVRGGTGGEASARASLAWLASQGVRAPERFARWLAP